MERLLGTNLYVASAAILIVTGSIVAIISFLGTFGAYKEIKCMILTYFVILVVLFIVMVTAGILGYVFRLEVDDRMQQEMHSTIKLYGNDSQVTQAWDAVQMHVSCSCSEPRSHSYGQLLFGDFTYYLRAQIFRHNLRLSNSRDRHLLTLNFHYYTTKFKCCGITVRPARGYELWKKENAKFKSDTGPTVPESCCQSREDDPIRRSCQGRQPRREDTYYEVSYCQKEQ